MKRVGNIYAKVYSKKNLRKAAAKAAQGKGDHYGVQRYKDDPKKYIDKLHDLLVTKTYRTSPYKHRTIWEGKLRTLSILPFFPDNIIDHAIINVIGDTIASVYTRDTYSCIKGRGIQGCMEAVDKAMAELIDEPVIYCLKLDIHHYFDSVDHDLLKQTVRRKIKDPDLLWLIDEIIDSIEGIPIGRYFSQWTSNWFLSDFDHKIKEVKKVKYYFRYMDDITVLDTDKKRLHALLGWIREYLTNLKLEIKDNYQIYPIAANRYSRHGRGLDFVGFVWYRDQKLLRRRIKKNFCHAAAKLQYPTMAKLSSWVGWVKYSNSKHLFKAVTGSNYYDFCHARRLSQMPKKWQKRRKDRQNIDKVVNKMTTTTTIIDNIGNLYANYKHFINIY